MTLATTRAATPATTPAPAPALTGDGIEWVVEAFGCDAARLKSVASMARLLDEMVATLGLRPVAPALWHQFPAPGGVTGLVLLAESHLAVHTFPEHGSLCLNLFCCAPRGEWTWADGLARHVGAARVNVRRLGRRYAPEGVAHHDVAHHDVARGAPPDITMPPVVAPAVTLAPPTGPLAPAER